MDKKIETIVLADGTKSNYRYKFKQLLAYARSVNKDVSELSLKEKERFKIYN